MKNLFLLVSVILAAMVCSNVSAYAYADPGAINSNAVQDLRLHEALSRTQSRSAILTPKKVKRKEGQEQTNPAAKEVLSNIKNVSFVNNFAITSGELFAAIGKYINQPMTPENIAAVRKEIMRYYQNKGYYSAVAMVVSENIKTGDIVFDIKEGGKESIVIQENI